jgi:CHAT domain-containing protein
MFRLKLVTRKQFYSGLLAIGLFLSLTTAVPAISAADLVQQGQSYYQQGQFGAALNSWQQAETAYRQTKDLVGVAGSRSNQSQALVAMGLYRRACKTLVETAQTNDGICAAGLPERFGLRRSNLPTVLQVQVLSNLGEVLRLVGNLPAAQVALAQAWEVAKPLPSQAKTEILVAIANTLRDLGNRDRGRTNKLGAPRATEPVCPTQPVPEQAAHSYYQQAIACYRAAGSLTAQLNQLNLQVDISRWLRQQPTKSSVANWQLQNATLIAQIKPQFSQSAVSHEGLNQRINFARSLGLGDQSQWPVAQEILQTTIATARSMGNQTALVNAIGGLGWLQEQAGQWPIALDLTKQALGMVGNNDDHLYQWEWQLARILRRQSVPDLNGARAAYGRALAALEKTRSNLRVINADAQFSLRDSVEPLYLEAVDLNLKSARPDLSQVINQVDALQLAELENFLRCQLSRTTVGNVSDKETINELAEYSKAVVFYPIILADRLELVLRLPGNKYERVVVPVGRVQLEAMVQKFRDNLTQPQFGWDEAVAGQLYDWLIRPAQPYLGKGTKQLVFVMDGVLQNVPVAALYDRQRQQYAIDQYPLAVNPGLKILGARRSGRSGMEVLIGGLTRKSAVTTGKRVASYEPLQFAAAEVQGVKKLFARSTELVGADFTVANIRRLLGAKSYGVIHLATHGIFSSDPSQTFIVTEGGGSINLDSLEEMLRQRGQIDLMVLSACETAAGDRRASLGLAGVALKSGAASTLASLWSVDDEATSELMQGFYGAWNRGMSKGQALRVAQQRVRQDHPHPYYWAAFMLVGNWL